MRSAQDYNCLGQTMVTELSSALEKLSNDEKIKVIVICSEVKNVFCAGGDIKLLNSKSLDYEFAMRN